MGAPRLSLLYALALLSAAARAEPPSALAECSARLRTALDATGDPQATEREAQLTLNLTPCDALLPALDALPPSTLDALTMPGRCLAPLAAALPAWLVRPRAPAAAQALAAALLRTESPTAVAGVTGALRDATRGKACPTGLRDAVLAFEGELPAGVWEALVDACPERLPSRAREVAAAALLDDHATRALAVLDAPGTPPEDPSARRRLALLRLEALAGAGRRAELTRLAKPLAAELRALRGRPERAAGEAQLAAAWLRLGARDKARRLASAVSAELAKGGPEAAFTWNEARLRLYAVWLGLDDDRRALDAMSGFYSHNYAFSVPAFVHAWRVAARLRRWEVAASWVANPAPAILSDPHGAPLDRMVRAWLALPDRPTELLAAMDRAARRAREPGPDGAPRDTASPRVAYVTLAEAWRQMGALDAARAALQLAAPVDPEGVLETPPWGLVSDGSRGALFERLGDRRAAAEAWRLAVAAALAPDDALERAGQLIALLEGVPEAADSPVLEQALRATLGRCGGP